MGILEGWILMVLALIGLFIVDIGGDIKKILKELKKYNENKS